MKMLELPEFYFRPHVRQRMIEFLGGTHLEEATCIWLTTACDTGEEACPVLPPAALWSCLERGCEIKRSLWDRTSLIVHLDVEYVNFDFPAEPYLDPKRTFDLQSPVIHELQTLLLEHGIAPLHLLSGRGHHLIWRVRRDSDPFERLAELGVVPETLGTIYRAPQPPGGAVVGPALGRAFAGIGQVLEFLAHRVLDAQPAPLPLELTEVVTSRGERGREIVSLDLSEYGDPLPTRMIRIPFSAYQKVHAKRDALGAEVADAIPPLYVIPLFEMDYVRGLEVMRDAEKAARLARVASAEIPDRTEGTGRLLEAYRGSAVARCHDWFYAQEQDPPWRWPETYDRTPWESLSPCVRSLLEQPNDRLLKPVAIRHLVRVFLSLGWHPRHIAGLLRSKYERDFGWGMRFLHYDATTRAEFYVRLFSTLIATGRDSLEDFTCDEARAVELCTPEACHGCLDRYRLSLEARRHHERLACRPLHGLFLPDPYS